MGTGTKRKRRTRHTSGDLTKVLGKFLELSEDYDMKRRRMEAELEEKRREQERKHEERMMRLMMGCVRRIMGFTPHPSSQTHPPFSPTSPYPPTFTHSNYNGDDEN